MVVKHMARAGTFESSDISVVVLPCENGIEISLVSSVEKQFGDSIRETIRNVIESLGVDAVHVEAVDKGALDCTIRARVETALRRAGR